MRVVAGKYGSRPLKAVPGMNTRPTTDKVKEAIFSALGGYLDCAYCLDFYGGSGGLAIEAVSRGTQHAVITEKYRPALKTIQDNIAMTKEPECFTLLAGDNRQALLKWQAAHPTAYFDLVLLDPPYATQTIVADIEWLASNQLVQDSTVFVCETDDHTQLPEAIADFGLQRVKRYGQTQVYFYEKDEA